MIDRLIDAGYPYELAGLVFYAFFLTMTRGRGRERYTQRTRILTLVAAMGLVASVPLHFAQATTPVVAILLLGIAALISAFLDGRARA